MWPLTPLHKFNSIFRSKRSFKPAADKSGAAVCEAEQRWMASVDRSIEGERKESVWRKVREIYCWVWFFSFCSSCFVLTIFCKLPMWPLMPLHKFNSIFLSKRSFKPAADKSGAAVCKAEQRWMASVGRSIGGKSKKSVWRKGNKINCWVFLLLLWILFCIDNFW